MNSQGGHRLPRSQENHGRGTRKDAPRHTSAAEATALCLGRSTRLDTEATSHVPCPPPTTSILNERFFWNTRSQCPRVSGTCVNPAGFTVRGRREEALARSPRGPRSGQTQAQRGTWRGREQGRVDTGSRHLRPSTGPMGRGTLGWGRDGQKGSRRAPSHSVPAQHCGVTQPSHPAGRTLQKVPDSLLSCSTGHSPIHKPLPSGLSVLPMVFSEPMGDSGGENHHLK